MAEDLESACLLGGHHLKHLATLRVAGCKSHVEVYLVKRKGQHAAQNFSTALLHMYQPQYAALLELSMEA